MQDPRRIPGGFLRICGLVLVAQGSLNIPEGFVGISRMSERSVGFLTVPDDFPELSVASCRVAIIIKKHPEDFCKLCCQPLKDS
eukprot:3983895-Pyramimonas_sp.AAC.1